MDKPFRLIISDVFKGLGSGFSVVGRVSSGSVQAGDRVLVQPAGDLAVVKGSTSSGWLQADSYRGVINICGGQF